MSDKRGFTVLELIIVVVIVAVFAAIVAVFFGAVIKKAERTADESLLYDMNLLILKNKIKTPEDAAVLVYENGYTLSPDLSYNKEKNEFEKDGVGFAAVSDEEELEEAEGTVCLNNSIKLTRDLELKPGVTLIGCGFVIYSDGAKLILAEDCRLLGVISFAETVCKNDLTAVRCVLLSVDITDRAKIRFCKCELPEGAVISGESDVTFDLCRTQAVNISEASENSVIRTNTEIKTVDKGKNTAIIRF